jgi:hypothetical protein
MQNECVSQSRTMSVELRTTTDLCNACIGNNVVMHIQARMVGAWCAICICVLRFAFERMRAEKNFQNVRYTEVSVVPNASAFQ